MSWVDEVMKTDAFPVVCVEIECADETRYYASAPLCEAAAAWDERLKAVSQLDRRLDVSGRAMQVSDLSLVFFNEGPDDDEAGHFGALLRDNVFDLVEARLYLKFKDSSAAVHTEQVYTGQCLPELLTATEFTLRASHHIVNKLGPLQRQVNARDYPNAPESSIGRGLPVHAGRPVTLGGMGQVELPMLDDTPNAQKFGGMGGIIALDHLYRHRSGAIEELTEGVDYIITNYAVDGGGSAYWYVTLAAGVYQDQDRYLATLRGLPIAGTGHVTLDGTTQFLAVLAADSANFPGRSGQVGSFTVALKYTPDNGARQEVICGIWEESGNDRAWVIIRDGQKIKLGLSGNGTTEYWAQADTTLLSAGGIEYYIWASYLDGDSPGVNIEVDGRTQSLTETGNCPSALHASNADFRVGYDSVAGFNKVGGGLHCIYLATGYQTGLAASLEISKAGAYSTLGAPDLGALEGILHEYQFYSDGRDFVGDADLEAKGGPSFTFPDMFQELNPCYALDKLLRWKWFNWRLPARNVKRSSLYEAAERCYRRGYFVFNIGEIFEAYPYWGVVIPEVPHELDSPEDPWNLLQELARSFDHFPIINREGRLALVCVDATDTTQEAGVTLRDNDGDLEAGGLAVRFHPIRLCNKVRAQFKHSHQYFLASGNGYGDYALLEDPSSQDHFGEVAEEVWNYRFITDESMLRDVATRQLLLRSGLAKLVEWPIPGLWGLREGCEIGDVVGITARRALGQWTDRKCIVVGNTADLRGGTSSLALLTVGDQLGPIGYIRGTHVETSSIALPEVDTYVNEASGGSAYGTLASLVHGEIEGGTSRRAAYKFVLPKFAGSIQSAALRLYIMTAVNASQLQIRQLTSPPAGLGNSSTWDNFNGAGSPWSDATNIGGTQLGLIHAPGAGLHTIDLNSSGVWHLNAAGGGGAVYLTHQVMNTLEPDGSLWESYEIASAEHPNAQWRPVLVLNYT